LESPVLSLGPEDSESEERLCLGRLRRSDYLVERSRSNSPSDDSNPASVAGAAGDCAGRQSACQQMANTGLPE
jgi:hypothetical protein